MCPDSKKRKALLDLALKRLQHASEINGRQYIVSLRPVRHVLDQKLSDNVRLFLGKDMTLRHFGAFSSDCLKATRV